MNYFSRYYDDQGEIRSSINNKGLGKIYKRVLDEYNECMEIEEYLVSFLLIQNLLEDRLFVFYKMVVENYISGDEKPLTYYQKNNNVHGIINKLADLGCFNENLKRNLLVANKLRNTHIHFSFMNTRSYDKGLSEGFYKLFREVDSLIRKLRRELKKK